MPNYRRVRIPGGIYFFTVVTHGRRPILCTPQSRAALRQAVVATRRDHPFDSVAWVLMPDHLHTVWRLPEDDADYDTRWRLIKSRFSHLVAATLPAVPAVASRVAREEQHVWQRRYWEHAIRDEQDLRRHVDYIHFNPVKHGLVAEPEAWPYSTYHRYAAADTTRKMPSPEELDIPGAEYE
jgi:putative transposase